MKKNIKNTFKPAYTVDATWCENANDLKIAFIYAKAGNAIISKDELDYIVAESMKAAVDFKDMADTLMNTAVDAINTVCECIQEKRKKPWYKRLWNWITRKKD